MALLRSFALVGLDAVLYTAEVRPGQKRLHFQCEQDLGHRLDWDFRAEHHAPAQYPA
ncbi:MAG TPA: hypothetical protein VH682_15820 [Gemmataceae bacterium]